MDHSRMQLLVIRSREIRDRIAGLFNRVLIVVSFVEEESPLLQKLSNLTQDTIELSHYRKNKLDEIFVKIKQIELTRGLNSEEQEDLINQLIDLFDQIEAKLTILEKQMAELLKNQ